MRRELAATLAAAALLAAAGTSRAAVISEDELADESAEAGLVAKSFGFVLAGPVLAPPINVEDASPASVQVFDLRGYVSYHDEHWRLVLHQPMTAVVRSHASLGLLALGRGGTPPRLLPLSVVAADGPTLRLSTETDWAYAAYQASGVSVTIGRQPVTLGRGQIFKPWDLVSTFTLTEVDREFKPGVDAVRVDYSPSAGTTLTAVGSAGELESDHDLRASPRGSSAVAQLKQGFRGGELSALGGFVRGDALVGWGALWDLGSLDLYGEATLTWAEGHGLSSPAVAGRSAPVMRALLGATLHPTSHLIVIPEAYYEGFGARRARGYAPVALSERVAVGDQLVLGQPYGGGAFDWEAHPLVHVTGSVLVNAADPSALASIAARFSVASNTRLAAGAYVPFGERPAVTGGIPVPRSEFGLYPTFGFVELVVVL